MNSKEISPVRRLASYSSRSACLVSLFAWQVASGADVPVSKGSSSGTGASINLSIASLITTNTGNLGQSSGTAPAPYSVSKSAVPLNVNTGVPLVLDLVGANGAINSSASSNVDGSPGSKTTAATAQVVNLSLDVAQLLGGQPLVSVGAPTVTTNVSVAGQGGSFTSNSSVSLTGLTLKVLGASIDLSGINLSNVPPNTGVNLGANAVAGLAIILNETQTTGNAAGGLTTTTNAIRIKLNAVNLGLINVLNGDVIIGHADAAEGSDPDGDGIFSGTDGDSDGDGIPDAVEIANAAAGGDTDGDGVADYLDLDSDNDGINDVIEAGGKDANGDGRQDASGDGNPDEDGDGIVDSVDPNDLITGGGHGVALTVPDTDGDGAKNYLDLDSDNDGISDVVESGVGLNTDTNGVFHTGDTDGDGIDNAVDGLAGYGDAPGSSGAPLDTDNDGIPNAYEVDSDNNGTKDIAGTPYASLDGNGDGRIDNGADTDHDGVPNVADVQPGVFGGLPNPAGDNDGDGISNGAEGSGLVDTDGDGVADIADGDSDGDGIPDLAEGPGDLDRDGVPNARDLDSDNDGINDVIEGGGKDTDGNGLQDPSGDGNADEDHDGIVDSVDSNDAVAGGGTGVALTLPDTDGDGAKNFLDLDSDNDTISDLVESGLGAVDSNNDGIGEGADTDQDGLVASVDGLPGARGDANGSTPIDTDGDGIPNYIDPNSDNTGSPDIVGAGNGALDANHDGKVDNATDSDGDGIPDVADNDDINSGGLGFNLKTYAQWVNEQFSSPANTNPAISGQEADPDGDGFTNAEEFAFGTDPEDNRSFPKVMTSGIPGAMGGVQATVTKDPTAYAFVTVEGSRDLVIWLTGPGAISVGTDQPALFSAQINNALPGGEKMRGFIRFRVIIP
ncbi:beta strand repeat-containing protein [Luteolibacter soli]|uniref:Uncharacterized protein n=1 Tax=Luteolibacter soli TaxID=3135280 RepID=A0ABU9B0L7_9BACT